MLVSQIDRMGSVRSLLLLFLLSLVEVHCQIFPYVSFMGQTLVNHSYVDLGCNDSDSVVCHTDLGTCCSGSQGIHRGDWYFPNGTRLLLSGDMYEVRGAQRVELRHTNATGRTGIYHCDIATNSVHDNTDNSVRETVYVGLYTTGEGSFSVRSQQTLKCLAVLFSIVSTAHCSIVQGVLYYAPST